MSRRDGVEARYAVALADGTRVGFVRLPQPPRREHTVRLHPLPAFRVAREPRRLYRKFLKGQSRHPMSEDVMLAEEQAYRAFGQLGLELHLVKQSSGRSVLNATVRLVLGEPPRVRITFWRLSARRDR